MKTIDNFEAFHMRPRPGLFGLEYTKKLLNKSKLNATQITERLNLKSKILNENIAKLCGKSIILCPYKIVDVAITTLHYPKYYGSDDYKQISCPAVVFKSEETLVHRQNQPQILEAHVPLKNHRLSKFALVSKALLDTDVNNLQLNELKNLVPLFLGKLFLGHVYYRTYRRERDDFIKYIYPHIPYRVFDENSALIADIELAAIIERKERLFREMKKVYDSYQRN